MVDTRPSSDPPAPSLTSLDPPERDSQPQDPLTLGPLLDDPPPAVPAFHSYEDLEIAAVQAELGDTDKAVREPYALSTDFRHSGWRHNRLLVFRALNRTNQPQSRRLSFSNCGRDAYVLQSVANPLVYKLAGSSCHDRFCLPCATERARAIALNVLEFVEDRRIRFLTLTLKASSDPLATQLDKLYESFQALRRRAFWKKRVRGGIAFLELTYNATTQTWHPHFHILIEGNYLDHTALRKLWYEITGDSFVIDIRSCNNNRQAARYVTKYASKPFNNTFLNRPDPLDEAILALKGRKLLLTFGSWRGLTVIATPSDDAWHNIGPLEDVIQKAAAGDPPSLHILAALTDADLAPLLARSPPIPSYRPPPDPPLEQLTFLGVWTDAGSYL